MNRQPFVKLAFLAATTGYVAALAGVWILAGWVAALACALLGFVLYVVLQLELTPGDDDKDAEAAEELRARLLSAVEETGRPRLRQPAEGTRGFDRIQ